MAEFYPDAYTWFSTDEYPTCVPMYSNIPGNGIGDILERIIKDPNAKGGPVLTLDK